MLILLMLMTSLAQASIISTMVTSFPSIASSSAASHPERPPPQITTFCPFTPQICAWVTSMTFSSSMPLMAGTNGTEPVATKISSATASAGVSGVTFVFSRMDTPSFSNCTPYQVMSSRIRFLNGAVAIAPKVPPIRSEAS